MIIHNSEYTCTIAGSCGKVWWDFGVSHTCKSLMSLALKIIYSYTSSLGATGLSVGLPSVPNERTIEKKNILLAADKSIKATTMNLIINYEKSY